MNFNEIKGAIFAAEDDYCINEGGDICINEGGGLV